MPTLVDILLAVQATAVAGLAVFGLHRGFLVLRHLRARRRPPPRPAAPTTWPAVTVQLPLYNEPNVAVRLLQAVAAFDYPRHRLRIQVLDDSNDDTTARLLQAIRSLPADLRVEHVRRADRHGFKAGALAEGLRRSDDELVAVFDSDFVPPPDFLQRMVPDFVDADVGMVQARWEHLNAGDSALTETQRLLLDGHFVIEHHARAAAGCFFNFNGTAGVFRRACIDDAGGWQHDTLTEDLDLSYRAQMRGWRFRYRPDVTCPAELPGRMTDFLGQQHRWAKGAVQTARKLFVPLLRTRLPWRVKLEAAFHLLGNVSFLLLLLLMLSTLPLQALRLAGAADTPAWATRFEGVPLGASLLCVLWFYLTAQASAGRLRPRTVLRLPATMALGAGMTINNTAAVLEALGPHTGEFVRTPKAGAGGDDRARLDLGPRGWLPWLELLLAGWTLTTAVLSFALGHAWTGVFHALFATGLTWVGGSSLRDLLLGARRAPQPKERTA